MSAALTAYADPKELVPGEEVDVDELALKLASLAVNSADTSQTLRSVEAGSWVGPASEAFRERIGAVPARLDRAADAFHDAGRAFASYAEALREARGEAARAVELMAEADAATQLWAGAVQQHDAALAQAERNFFDGLPARPVRTAAPSATDPGEELRHQARRTLEVARDLVADQGRNSSQALRVAQEHAPDQPGLFSRAAHQVGEFFKGAGEATVDLVEFGFKLTPTYALIDTDGYVENLQGLADGIKYGIENPKEFAKAALDWETLKENPARALGHLVPDLVLAVATAGTGTAGSASSRAATAARKLEEASAAALRAEGRRAGVPTPHPGRWDSPEARKDWVDQQLSPRSPHRREVTGSKPYDDYQREVAGDSEVRLNPTDAGNRIWADSLALDPDKVVAIEAKYVGRPGNSPYEGNLPPPIQAKVMARLDDEVRRYAVAMSDPAVPVERLRIITNTDAAAAYLEQRVRTLCPLVRICRSW